MKNIKLFIMVAFLAAATTMILTSCSKEKRIEGKWKITHATGVFSDDKGETWTFKSNRSGSFICSGWDVDGDWSISGDELTIDAKLQGYKVVGEFSIDKLNSSKMSLSGSWKVDGEKENVTYEFEKK